MDKKLYSVEETLKLMSICRATLYKLINSGELKIVHIGRKTLIPDTEIDKLIKTKIEG